MQYLAKDMPDELVQNIVLKIGGSWGDGTPEDRQFFKKFAALVAAAERERIIAANAPEIEKVNAHIKALEDGIAAAIRAREEK